ncbi:MAG: acetyltransferase [Ruminococcaceae bacterium]|nr:acetyltransferase [Oscillospiraceae bacterium]
MSYKPLAIIGASGHGRVVADVAKLVGYKEIVFLDDADVVPEAGVVGKVSDFVDYKDEYAFFVAIGNNGVRERVFKQLQSKGAEIVSLIHPSAYVSDSVRIGKGVVVMACAAINCGAVISDGVIVNTSSSVDHDCSIGAFSHVSVGAHIAGTVAVGTGTFIGAGATVINNVSICDNCTIGAGAVVIKSIESSGTYVGVPAEKVEKKD